MSETREALKLLFKNGLKPSEIDFEKLLDSYVHLDDPLDTVVPRATQPEAEAGLDNEKVITPLTLVATITALVRLANLSGLLTDVQGEVNTAVAALVDSSPGVLDTLNELAAALGDDPNFATTVATNLSNATTALVNGAPANLDTLNKLAIAIGNDPAYSATIAQQFTDLIDGAPSNLDTLGKLANSLQVKLSTPFLVGEFAMSGVLDPFIVAMSENRVAFVDQADQLKMLEFQGNTFVQIGSTFAITGSGYSMAALSATRIAVCDSGSDTLRTYDFNGSVWSQTGNSLALGSVSEANIAAMTSTRVSFVDDAIDNVVMYEFDGTDWTQVGNKLDLGNIPWPNITGLTSTRAVIIDQSSDDLIACDFDGTDWTELPNPFNVGAAQFPTLAALGEDLFAFLDAEGDELRIYGFDGTNFERKEGSLSMGDVSNPQICAMSPSRVAVCADGTFGLKVYQFTHILGDNSPPSPAL